MSSAVRSWRNVTASHDETAQAVAFAHSGDGDAFQRLAEHHRAGIQLHCYRMLGSFHEAEDVTAETFVRAWRGMRDFEGRASLRNWLYRIATNACLNAIETRRNARRILPVMEFPSSVEMPEREPASDVAWLEPCPDAAIVHVADGAPGPDAQFELRESVRLAFIAAIQHLPGRQRAVLLLHDVLGWTAGEVGTALDTSSASIGSALQRARASLARRLPSGRESASLQPQEEERTLLDRYMRSWETADVDAFVAVLREDAVISMPPWRQWYRGRNDVARFFTWTTRPGGHAPFRLLPTRANGQPAFAFYSRWQGTEWRAHSIQLLDIDKGEIAAMTSFVDPHLFPLFALPSVLPT